MSTQFLNELERQLNLPIPLGPFTRVFVDYHKNWGIDIKAADYKDKLKEAEDSYISEYAASTGSRTGFQGSVGNRNYNQELNEQNAIVVARLAYDIEGPINLTDLGGGAGATTELAYRAMQRLWQTRGRPLTDLRKRLHLTFVEPSGGMIRDAMERLGSFGIDYVTFSNAPAHMITNHVEPESQDICMETSALHHYPNPQKPYKAAHKILKPGGVFVVNEWCHSLFEHPLRFMQVLKGLEWPTKREDIVKYSDFFGFDEDDIYLDGNGQEAEANKKMLEWYVERFRRTVDYVFYTLEAHCPPRHVFTNLREAGFMLEGKVIGGLISEGVLTKNPHNFSPLGLHSSFVGVKV